MPQTTRTTQTAQTSGGTPTSLVPSSARSMRNWQYRNFVPLLPGMLFLLAIAIYPTIYSLVISFFRWNLTDPEGMSFGGLHNYALLLSDESFWHALLVTAEFVVVTVTVELALGLAIGLLF